MKAKTTWIPVIALFILDCLLLAAMVMCLIHDHILYTLFLSFISGAVTVLTLLMAYHTFINWKDDVCTDHYGLTKLGNHER